MVKKRSEIAESVEKLLREIDAFLNDLTRISSSLSSLKRKLNQIIKSPQKGLDLIMNSKSTFNENMQTYLTARSNLFNEMDIFIEYIKEFMEEAKDTIPKLKAPAYEPNYETCIKILNELSAQYTGVEKIFSLYKNPVLMLIIYLQGMINFASRDITTLTNIDKELRGTIWRFEVTIDLIREISNAAPEFKKGIQNAGQALLNAFLFFSRIKES